MFRVVYRNEKPKAAEMCAHVGPTEPRLSSVCFCEDRHRHITDRLSDLHHRVRPQDRTGNTKISNAHHL